MANLANLANLAKMANISGAVSDGIFARSLSQGAAWQFLAP